MTDTLGETACSCDSSRLLVVRNDRNTVGSNPSDDSFAPVQDSESTVFKDDVEFGTLASERLECSLRPWTEERHVDIEPTSVTASDASDERWRLCESLLIAEEALSTSTTAPASQERLVHR